MPRSNHAAALALSGAAACVDYSKTYLLAATTTPPRWPFLFDTSPCSNTFWAHDNYAIVLALWAVRRCLNVAGKELAIATTTPSHWR